MPSINSNRIDNHTYQVKKVAKPVKNTQAKRSKIRKDKMKTKNRRNRKQKTEKRVTDSLKNTVDSASSC